MGSAEDPPSVDPQPSGCGRGGRRPAAATWSALQPAAGPLRFCLELWKYFGVRSRGRAGPPDADRERLKTGAARSV